MLIYIDLTCYKSSYNHELIYRNYTVRDCITLYNTLLKTIGLKWMLQLILSILLCILYWTSQFLVVLSENPNTLFDFLHL
jgi:hypothetical protein